MKRIIYGHLVEIEMYRDMLEKENITCMIKNEFEEASHAGFGSGLPGNVDLFVDEENIEKASFIINAHKESQK
ncbi:putative signal transducing protein [Labilibacter marinus]|uniref:putative signal transducing protein n=1 Tax=Labilibacter marinus TaxID=1477105 RepID=UPI0008FF3C5C|nr:DUF2007 domain-containing protein [Labilibacter marinus]